MDLLGVANDEHGSLTWRYGVALDVGDIIKMVPSHLINLHDFYYGRDIIEKIWPVAARGRSNSH